MRCLICKQTLPKKGSKRYVTFNKKHGAVHKNCHNIYLITQRILKAAGHSTKEEDKIAPFITFKNGSKPQVTPLGTNTQTIIFDSPITQQHDVVYDYDALNPYMKGVAGWQELLLGKSVNQNQPLRVALTIGMV